MKITPPLVYGLIACIFLVSVPHAEHLPIWVSVLSAVMLSWRAYLSYTANSLPKRWLLILVTLVCVCAIALSFRTLFGREVGVTLLILLGSLKLLELREVRDATVLLYLCCFVIITNFFYSQSIPTALFMLFSLLVIMTTWVHLQTGSLVLQSRLRIAATILLQAIPLSLLIFVLFPRVQGPLWGMPQDAYGSSGLSDNMAPGSMSKLTLSDAVAFRATFNGQTPSRNQMYWRGPVLWDFDGRAWTRGHNATLQQPRLDKASQPVSYVVTLEPHNKTWIFTLDMPVKISIPADFAPDFQVLSKAPVNVRLRYNSISVMHFLANLDEPPQQLHRALAIPEGFNPRARLLAADWRKQAEYSPFLQSKAGKEVDEFIVKMALENFSKNNFEYTLEPPSLGVNSVDDFLFETHKGFCEYYASSFVFLMRAAGIPARVVTGYQGGEYNDLGDYYVVRQSDAHAWAEVWLKDRGWVRYDPTAVIAPGRILNGLSASLPNNTALPFFERTQSSLLLKLRLNLDALTNQWNQWVLGYNTERQFAFLTRLGMEDITWQKLAMNMFAGVSLLVGIFTLLMLRKLQFQNTDEVQRLYLKFCKKLARSGIERAPHEGAQDFADRASKQKKQLATVIQNITTQYIVLRYQNRHDANDLKTFKQAVSKFPLGQQKLVVLSES
jgi:transglutaminase-like putative cysteine protease